MPLFNEKSLIEDYFVEQLQVRSGKRWRFVGADELEREATEEPLLTSAFIRALKSLNKDIGIGDDEVKQVLNELKLRTSGSEDSKKILNYFKDGVPIKFEKERVVKYVKLFDYDNIGNNDFVVSRQITHQAGDKQIRNDIILYVNGIPLVNIECKNPASLTETWYNAFMQILGYEHDVPELYKYIQIGVASDNKAKYFPTTPWQQDGEPKYYEWRDGSKDSINSTIRNAHARNAAQHHPQLPFHPHRTGRHNQSHHKVHAVPGSRTNQQPSPKQHRRQKPKKQRA